MARTPLYDKLAALGGEMGEYAATETALSFGDAMREFDAIRSACAVYDLGWRAKLAITGSDRVRWLNGMVTNNVRDLAVNQGNYSFVLNAQGRILGDCYAYNRGEYLLVGTEMNQVEALKQIFDRFIIMDDVEVTDVSDKLTAIAVQGPHARAVLEGAGIPGSDVGAMELLDVVWRDTGLSITRMASEEFLTYELWCSPQNIGALWDAIRAAGAIPVGMKALELFRIAAGVPKYGQDIRERDLPQETEQLYALNHNKGCYVGQEIVERIRSRGQVHRKFTGFVIEGDPVVPGTKIQVEGKDAGEITSVARIDDRVLALGYVRREHATPGTQVDVGATRVRVASVPFDEAKARAVSRS